MKLLIRDYLLTLKEEGELDILLCNLLFAMNLRVDTKPKKGVRQFGVDIKAIGNLDGTTEDTSYIFVIKQGDITRKNWDVNIQDVRPTLGEIIDCYDSQYPLEKNKLKKIIVATNGKIDQALTMNWNNYIERNTTQVFNFEFWGIDKISLLVEEYFFNEFMFPREVQAKLTRILVNLNQVDFSLEDLSALLSSILTNKNFRTQKLIIKQLKLINIVINLLYKWAQENKYITPTLHASEFILLSIWDWLIKNNYLGKKKILNEYKELFNTHMTISLHHFIHIREGCYIRNSVAACSSNDLETRLTSIEHLGLLSLTGIIWFEQMENSNEKRKFIQEIYNALIAFVQNNSTSFNPTYDDQSIDYNLLFIFLKKLGMNSNIKNMILSIMNSIINENYLYGKFPLFTENYNHLLELNFDNKDVLTNSSTLLVDLLNWSIVLNDENLYIRLRDSICLNFKEINLQMWYPSKEPIKSNFKANATSLGLTYCSINIQNIDYDEYKAELLKVYHLKYTDEVNLIDDLSLLSLISSRHYRTLINPKYIIEMID